MSTAACPYCRGSIEDSSDDRLVCEGCGTQHHADCYKENCGCTVFGCRCAPAEEPKVSIATPDLAQTAAPAAIRPYGGPSLPPPPPPPGTRLPEVLPPLEYAPVEHELGAGVVPSIFSSYAPVEVSHEPKSRTTFILLGALLGAFGAHNFYAGYKKKAWWQVAITVFTLGFASPMTWIWAIIDVCTIDRDEYGITFSA